MQKKTEGSAHPAHSPRRGVIIAVLLAAFVLIAVVAVLAGQNRAEQNPAPVDTTPETVTDNPDFQPVSLGGGITVTRFCSYTGLFLEDGSDRLVTNIASVTVENTGSDCVQWMVFSLRAADGFYYEFELTTLLPGQKMIVLEKHASPFQPEDARFTPEIQSYAVFPEAPSLYEDVISLTVRDSHLIVKNISDQTVTAGRVFYKHRSGDYLMGGITYMASFSELRPGEEITLNPGHFNADESRLLFVTYAG